MKAYDAHWQQSLENYKPAATDQDWADMREQLPPVKPPRRAYWWWGALLTLVAGVTVWYQLPHIEHQPESIATITPVTASGQHRVPVGPLPSQRTAKVAEVVKLPDLRPVIANAYSDPSRPEPKLLVAVSAVPTLRYPYVAHTDYLAEQMRAFGKTLIVVPPPSSGGQIRSDNGFYPPVRIPKQ